MLLWFFNGRLKYVVLALSLTPVTSGVLAQEEVPGGDQEAEQEVALEEGEEAASQQQAVYLPLKPAFIINYGESGSLRYVKTDVSVRLKNSDAAYALRTHMPFVRNNLLMLLAAQSDESVTSQEGKEKIRVDALSEIRDILERENRTPREDVVAVYFNNFIVQK